MTALALLVVLLPLLPAATAAVTARARPLGLVSAAAGLATLGVAVTLAVELSSGHGLRGLSGFLYLDPLSGFFLATIALVVALSSFGSGAYLRTEEQRGEVRSLQVRLYFISFALFASPMLASLETGNLGLLWVLIEGSTLASCVLVGLLATGTRVNVRALIEVFFEGRQMRLWRMAPAVQTALPWADGLFR
jgi:hydrogenase-4 component F